MPWINIDDSFDEHPKIATVGPLGWALWLAGLAYCNRNLTDGFIPWAKARSLVSWDFLGPADADGQRKAYSVGISSGAEDSDVRSEFVIDLLCKGGLWEVVDGGYQVHDYTDWQRSRSQIEGLRETRSSSGRKGGQASAQARTQANTQANIEANQEANAKPSEQAESAATREASCTANGEANCQANSNPQPNPQPQPQVTNTTENSPRKPPRGGAKFDAIKVDLPECLDFEEGREAWEQWVKHRSHMRKPLTPESVAQQLIELEKCIDPIAVIRRSIANSWQGLFPKKEDLKDAQIEPSRRKTAEERFAHIAGFGEDEE